MPKPLHITTVKATFRLEPETLDMLRLAHGEGKVNEVVRAVLGAYANRLRVRLTGRESGTAGPPIAEGPLSPVRDTQPRD